MTTWQHRTCTDCDVRWLGDDACWSCGREGSPVPPHVAVGYMRWDPLTDQCAGIVARS